ncbi:MAG: sugar nucleotide-binding protein, partial [Cyanobacteria bacterium P01_H01_bin.121]
DGTQAPYTEQAAVSPISHYGEKKVTAERQVLQVNPDAIVARLPLMFGTGETAASNFMQQLLINLRSGTSTNLFTDEFRTPTSGWAAAQGLLLLAQKAISEKQGKLADLAGLVHLGGPERISRFDLGCLVAKVINADTSIIQGCRQQDVQLATPRPQDTSLVSDRARSLGYSPATLLSQLQPLATA